MPISNKAAMVHNQLLYAAPFNRSLPLKFSEKWTIPKMFISGAPFCTQCFLPPTPTSVQDTDTTCGTKEINTFGNVFFSLFFFSQTSKEDFSLTERCF